jgi:hypothetical protein
LSIGRSGREAALESRLGLLVACFGTVEEPAQRRAVDQLALAPAAVGAVIGLVDEGHDLGALRVGEAGCERALALGPARGAIVDRRGIADRLLEDRDEEFRRMKPRSFTISEPPSGPKMMVAGQPQRS